MFVERSRNKSIDKRAYCATLKARIIYSNIRKNKGEIQIMLENHEMSVWTSRFSRGKTHHNWYLFEDKIDSASSEFKIIEVDELCQKNIGTKSGE